MKRLFLFTNGYPYFQFVEFFLEDEIDYLSRSFDEIVIVPFEKDKIVRPIPNNCVVTEPILKSKIQYFFKGLYNRGTLGILLREFFVKKVCLSRKRLFVWLKCYFQSNNYMNSPVIKEIEKAINVNDICYHYWGKWSNVVSVFMNTRCHHVSRFHGFWDLWEEDFDNYAPLRSYLVKKLDYEVFISKKGQTYFEKKYPESHTVYSPLGSLDYGNAPSHVDNICRIVSCSTVYPLKRVPLIIQGVVELAKLNPNKYYSWTHIGSGESFQELKTVCLNYSSLDNLQIDLKGNKSHDDVIEIYQKEHFDVFVNLSINEGVPVSIMEAISFDIPIVATNVGGNSEIVCNETGLLVSPNPSPEEVAKAIDFVVKEKRSPRSFWKEKFSADKNYGVFSDFLKSLGGDD